MLINMTFAFVIVVTSVVAALISLILISVLQGRKAAQPRLADPTPQIEGTVFLFDDQELVDATGPARALLDATPLRGGDWARLSAFLAPRFDRFEARMATLAEYGTIEMTAKGDSRLHLVAEHLGGMARITLSDPQAEGQEIVIDALSHRALEDEVSALRTTVDAAPVLVWREDVQGAVIWANRAYLLQSGALEDDEGLRWPLPTLFDASLRAVSPGTARRLKIDRKPGEKPLWFECHAFPATEGTLHFALPCDAAVNAEVSLREFVQTLTKTFAHLPIGLAIFDRNRQLALFNPALMDLTTISPEFLTARPTLFAFLDRIRESRMMPEPKDYKSWRQKMADLEQAAANSWFEETWDLPTGQTYRVTGRPHPEGAVAFLFEDITAEVALTRRYRSELEMSQAVIDTMDEAIAVFSPAGALILSNSAYARLWGVDPGTGLRETGIGDAMHDWQGQSHPNPIWADARDFVTAMQGRAPWKGDAQLKSGKGLICRFAPLPGGTTLVGFRVSDVIKVTRTKRRPTPGINPALTDAREEQRSATG